MPLSAADLEAQIPQLRRYARTLAGDAWAADDLVQDTLERACDRWRLWQAGSDLRAWLFTLMHNLFIDGARRALRQQADQHLDLDDAAPELVAPSGPTDQALDLQRCLLRLPDEQREVLLLVTLQDLSYEEVARITGTPIGTVMSRLSRARSRLRELMEGGLPAAVVPLRRMK
ncbi:sigma-70 family RNA polymerase sigma factor [Ramlibacter humi]|uniref:Sigma-70 family RNA polymerase sigma factor n=1 Tax=Ramlibacter humi TaxID=2530451 RepID=A0A4Z0CCV7_9BURK|nr:sigma-70 family RNA polymerase sigma factor [Ramlibacter humi]TFZ08250.1 sigma-70 family RNA polymerase sigma factor [Ramlibacter humi]